MIIIRILFVFAQIVVAIIHYLPNTWNHYLSALVMITYVVMFRFLSEMAYSFTM